MQGFFGQFGTVAALRLSRSKKTGRSRGYAFIRFEDPAVAAIAQEAMDGYILTGKTLKCSIVPPENVHPEMFAGANKKLKRIPWQKMDKDRHNKVRTEEETKQRVARLVKADGKRRKRLQDLGIEYDFVGYKAEEKKEETEVVKEEEKKKVTKTKKAAPSPSKKKRKTTTAATTATTPKKKAKAKTAESKETPTPRRSTRKRRKPTRM